MGEDEVPDGVYSVASIDGHYDGFVRKVFQYTWSRDNDGLSDFGWTWKDF